MSEPILLSYARRHTLRGPRGWYRWGATLFVLGWVALFAGLGIKGDYDGSPGHPDNVPWKGLVLVVGMLAGPGMVLTGIALGIVGFHSRHRPMRWTVPTDEAERDQIARRIERMGGR